MPRWVKVLLATLATLAVLLALVYGLRNTIATSVLAYAVDEKDGVRCSHPKVEIDSAFDWVDIAPIECRLARGVVQRAETTTPTRIVLDGFDVARVQIGRATVDFRERDVSHVETNTLGDLGDIAGASDTLIKGMLDSSDMYQADAPLVVIEQLTMLREGKKESVMRDLHKSMDGTFSRSHARRVDMGMEGLAAIRNFDMRVTPVRGRLTAGVYLGDAERGEEPDAQVRAVGEGFKTPKPKFDLSLDSDESRRERKSRAAAEARAEHSAKAPARER